MSDDDRDLTRLTINITPAVVKALSQAAALSESHRTDVVNLAIRVHLGVLEYAAEGGEPGTGKALVLKNLLGDGVDWVFTGKPA
jgi:hypothetical protein